MINEMRQGFETAYIDGYGGFLFFDKEGKPMVALH